MVVSNVRRIMEGRQVTVRKLMELSGLSNETILRARKDRIVQCRLETLVIIARCLGCKVKDLFEEC